MAKQKSNLNQEDIRLLKSIFATKDDLGLTEKRFSKIFATKDELVAFEVRTNQKFEELEEKIRLLPTRDQFLTKMDEVMGELKAIREENEVNLYRVSKHSDDIQDLQDIHPNNRHFALASNA